MAKKKAATAVATEDTRGKSELIRDAMTALRNPSASSADIKAWIASNARHRLPEIEALGQQLSAHVSQQREKVARQLGMDPPKKGQRSSKSDGKTLFPAKQGDITKQIQEARRLMGETGLAPDQLLALLASLRQYDPDSLTDGVEAWGEMVQAAKGDEKVAAAMLEILTKGN